MANIQILKLTTGEDIIGEVMTDNIDGRELLIVEKPCLIMMMPKQDNPNEFGIGLAPYAPFAKQHKVPVMPSHIVPIYEAEAELEKEYLERFGPGQKAIIAPPEKKIQLNG